MAFLRRIAGNQSGRLALPCRITSLSELQSARPNSPVLIVPEDEFACTSRFRSGVQYFGARFFAIPAQGKPKEDLKSAQGPRLNEAITAKFVRLVTDEGHEIVSRDEALDRARKLDVDLVEVQRTSTPPVCKIMDYHKERFKKETVEKERAKTKSESKIRKGDFKEVRLKGKIAQNDIEVKAEAVKGLVERGYRVKIMALPSKQRGSEECDLEGLLNRLVDLIEDVISVESGPFLEKQQAYVVVRHVKFASKKGTRKKPIAVASAPAAAESDSDSTSEDDVFPEEQASIPIAADKKLTPPIEKPGEAFVVERDQRYGRRVEANPRFEQTRPSGRNSERPVGSNPSNNPRRQENFNRQAMDTKESSVSGGNGGSSSPSYGIFSAPTRPASSNDRRR
ncbi:translation initiation factor 3 (IF-3) family protein [Wolffia australiana]